MRRLIFFKTLVLLLFVSSSLCSFAQSKSNKGIEFWVGFMFHYEGISAGHSLYITSDSNTSGTVSVPGESWTTNFTVTANNLTVVTIPSSVAYNGCSDCITSKGVKIVSDDNIVVYAHQYLGNQSDATLVLPTRTLGKEYFAASYYQSSASSARGRSTFLIVGTQDSTVIRITPKIAIQKGTATASTGSLPANTAYEVTLDEGEIYQGYGFGAASSDDVTGTSFEVIDTGITANCRKIAVFTGSSYARVGSGCSGGFNSGDNLYEQMFPINSWGKRFILVPSLGRSGDDFRFIAQEDGTEVVVFKSGAPDIFNLDRGEFAQIDNESAIRYCQSNKPIMAVQYQRTARCDGGGNSTGDPSMTVLNPLEQTLKDITLYSSEFADIDNHYINVVIPSFGASSFRIDGNSATFTSVPGNGAFSYTRISVSKGNHRLTANVGFIATAYGEGRYESYGYAAGANVIDLTAQAKVANSTQNGKVTNCIGRPTRFTGEAEYTVVRWEWDFGDGVIDSIQNPTHLYADTGTYVAKLYTYKPSFDGCSNYDSAFIEVKIYGKPIARFSKTDLCDSLTAIFTDQSTMPSGETKLISIWNIQGAGGFKYGSSVSHLFDTIGKFEVSMEVITNNQCKDTLTDSLIVNPIPMANFDISDACFYDSTYLFDQSFLLTGSIDTHRWEYSDFSGSLDENPSHYFQDSGRYEITLSVVSDSGCRDTMTKELYKYPRMDVSFSYNDTCFGEGNIFLNTSTKDGGIYTDTTWYTSVPDTAITYNYSATFGSIGSFTVQLVMEQDSFCTDTFTQIIEVDPLPVALFTVSGLCLSDSTSFLDATTLSSGSYTLEWDFDDGMTGSGSAYMIQYTSLGQKSVVLTATSDLGCESDTTISILITDPQIVSLNISDVCEGASQIFSSTNSLGLDSFSSYSWTVQGNVIGSGFITSYEATPAGIYSVNLDVMTKNGCEISLLDSFEAYVSPSADFLVSSVCDGENLFPLDNSTISAPATIDGYQWYLNGANISADQNPIIGTSGAGDYDIKLKVTTSNGCIDSIQKSATVYPVPNTAFNSANQCFGDNTIFTSSSSVSTGSLSTILWTIDGTDYTSNTVSYTFPSFGDYLIRLVSESEKGCRDTLNRSVPIHPLPILDVQLAADSGCILFDAEVINNSTISTGSVSNTTYTWGDGAVTQSNTNTYDTPGTYAVNVVAESDQGCRDSVDISNPVRVFDLPTADFRFTPLEPSTLTEFVTFKDSSSTDVVQWDWTTSDGGYYTGILAEHQFLDSGIYNVTLTVVNDKGCEDDISKLIYVNADLFVHIPSGFSPNGDGINDTYGLGGLTQGVFKLQLTIYNRWGELIYSASDVNDRWDGTYKGKPVPQGVYLYLVQYTNPKQTRWFYLNGEIHVLR